MKPILLLLLAALSAGLVRAQEVAPSATAPTIEPTARLIGKLPDGTPPPPQPPKPGFIAPAEDILGSATFSEGGRTITVQEIAPIDLPPPPEIVIPAEPSPALKLKLAELRARQPKIHHISLGATVYRDKEQPTRTLVTYWSFDKEEPGKVAPITLWSSADFSLLSGIPGFISSDGRNCSLMMAWGVQNRQRNTALRSKTGRPYQGPVIPELPAGKATFLITSGTPSETTLADIQSLHDLYNNEFEKLQAAAQGREQARLVREAELKAHPPQPKDIVLNHWRVEPAMQDEKEGGNR